MAGLPLAGFTGNGVRVAIVDSGVHASHPHVGNVVGGIRLRVDGQDADYVDVLGHGTAVTAAIHEKAPEAELIAVKIFDRQLTAGGDILARAIRYAAGEGARLVNLSLGTTNLARAPLLENAVAAATAMGGLVVAAREVAGTEYLPGILQGVASVLLDWTVPRDELEITEDDRGITFGASGYPAPSPECRPTGTCRARHSPSRTSPASSHVCSRWMPKREHRATSYNCWRLHATALYAPNGASRSSR